MSANYETLGPIAVISLDHPPVNSLDHATRAGVLDGLERALADGQIRAIVLTGAGQVFSVGADITEFNTPAMRADPDLRTLIAQLEAATKPVIAALHGTVMGGGLELALGCHYRVAGSGMQTALPEVKLGLLPGAGGTQRLPRVLGVETALNMIVKGDPVASQKLADTGLFDRLIESAEGAEVRKAAIAFAQEVLDKSLPLKKLRDIRIKLPNAQAFFQFARNSIGAVAKHYPAPMKCVDAIAASVSEPFDQGLALERQYFQELLLTPQSQALRHAFFAERNAAKIDRLAADTPLRAIKSVAVIGAGTMGGGITMNFVNAGIPVRVLEVKSEALAKGLGNVRRNYENTAKKGRLTAAQVEERMALITPVLEYAAIGDADLVIEAVYEDLGVKEQVFKTLDGVMKPGAILASNTSTLDLDKLAAFTKRPADVIGTHFFSPANVMRLLEIVRGKATADDVLATVMQLSKKIRKVGVVVGVCDGFVGNRMIEEYSRQAGFLLDEGALPQQVDRALENFGFAMGPFRMGDLAGNDIGWAIRKRRAIERPHLSYSRNADLLCEIGRFGQKTGAGWYDYKPGDRNAMPSEVVNNMIVAESGRLGLTRRKIGDEELVERLVYALVNEAAKILEEGIAQRASDIDVIYLSGYGFPVFRGGPMFYADTVGLANVVRAMRKYASGYHGEAWTPAPLLVRLAAGSGRFNG
jgi:3-hydroxyacyl-CoA dehydrogenase